MNNIKSVPDTLVNSVVDVLRNLKEQIKLSDNGGHLRELYSRLVVYSTAIAPYDKVMDLIHNVKMED